MRTAILPVGMCIASATAFVTLDTSIPKMPATPVVEDSGVARGTDSTSSAVKPVERVGSVLFLSGNDQRVYAALGLLKALQEMGLAPDRVVAEGMAAIPAAAYALGYKMTWLDSLFRVHPLETYVGQPVERKPSGHASPQQDEPEPLPWQRNLANGRTERNEWSENPPEPGKSGRLALSWLMARLMRGAPPDSARIPVAFQLLDARTGELRLEHPGNWQDLVEAAATSPGNAADAGRAPHWIDGSLISQHRPLTRHWPIGVENMVVLDVPASIAARPLGKENPSILGAMRSHWKVLQETGAGMQPGPMLSLILVPAGDLDSSTDWVEMGYQAGLRSADGLRVLFHARAPIPENPRRVGNEALLWSNISIAARGTGYFQLLRQRLRNFSRQGEPEDWIPELERGGFYSDLDVEWAERDGVDGEGGLVLGAQEDPRLLLSAGASLRIMGQSLLRQVPEGLVSLTWAEPHYLPFKAEGDWLIGGNHPGFGGQLLVEPPGPLWTRLSAYNSRQSNRYEIPFSDWKHAGAIPVSMREDRSGFRLGLGFSRDANVAVEIRRTTLDNLAVSPDPAVSDDGFASTDFLLTLHLKVGEGSGPRLRRLDFTTAYVDPINELGLVRPGFSLHRGEFQAALGPWEVFGQGQYADRVDFEWDYPDWPDAYALWLMPPMRPLTFGNEVRISRWHHFRYALAGGGWNYSWRKLSWRLVGGEATYMRLDGFFGAEKRGFFPFWEGGVSLATGLGPFRFACGGFGDSSPLFSVQWGTHLNLDRLLSDSEM